MAGARAARRATWGQRSRRRYRTHRLSLTGPRGPARARRPARSRRPSLPRLPLWPVALMLALLTGLAGGWLWVRDSSLAAVEDVSITGLTGDDAPAVRRALTAAARDMTTLHVRADRLRTAVAPYPAVRDVRVSADFPHRLRIEVIRHRAVAAAVLGGRRVSIARDGTVLRDAPASASLPLVTVRSAPGGGRVTDRRALDAVGLLAVAPGPLRGAIAEVEARAGGLTARMRAGLVVEFGPATRMRAKWAAVAGVLADERAIGASYLDVRVPERPVAGRFDADPVAVPSTSPEAPATTDPDSDGDPATSSAGAADPDSDGDSTTGSGAGG